MLEFRELRELAAAHAEAERAADYRAGVIAALIANAHRAKGSDPVTPATFFPSLEGIENDRPELSPEETKLYVRELMKGLSRRSAQKQPEA